ncbi:MAG: family 43 glycosylhydrolase [Clostridia bacterium]|nr:family 43 glycosylhydrolase [Clostridia bacterium]
MMKKKIWRSVAAVMAGILFAGSAGASEFETYLAERTAPSLKSFYAGRLETGLSAKQVFAEKEERITAQFSLIALEDTAGGKETLDRGASKKKKDPERAKVKSGRAGEAVEFAVKHGMNVRGATVVQPGHTPEWFFLEDWATVSGTPKVDRETMKRRMENALTDQIQLMNEKYPGAVSSWEVVRGNIFGKEDLYREIIGDEYLRIALETARKASAGGQKLLIGFDRIPEAEDLALAGALYEEGLLDGIVAEVRQETGEDREKVQNALRTAAETGMEIHLSGVEIAGTLRTAEGMIRLAAEYKWLFSETERLGGKSISLPALSEPEDGTEKTSVPRLMDAKGRCTAAFFGALQDEMIPEPGDDAAAAAAADRLKLRELLKKEAGPVIRYKKAEHHNPVMTQRFGADPWAMEYNGRIYLYMTGDDPATTEDRKPKNNDYANITTLRVLSSDDLVNWEDHGSIRAAGGTGAAKWARNSWAPCAAWKKIDGKDRFFLYFANSGGGIGVLTADSPTGPFTDPIGKALISPATPTCSSVTWLFDPAVLIDDDGSAYLYFGGGIPEGKSADPGTARVVKLQEDMISLDGDPVAIRPPWLFEDSGINKFGSTYVYSYCTNFQVPAAGSKEGFGGGEIVYMTSDRPMGPFTYAGRVLKNPGTFFGVGGNNHHCMFSFQGGWYITYHAATIDHAMGWNAGYRSTFVDRLDLNAEGLPAPSKGTHEGVAQLKAFDPYRTVPAATAVCMAGMSTEIADPENVRYGTGRTAAVSQRPDGWVAVAGVDFGKTGAISVRVKAKTEVAGKIEVITDRENDTPIASVSIPEGEKEAEFTAQLTTRLTGVHDLYFRFTESGMSLTEWEFIP